MCVNTLNAAKCNARRQETGWETWVCQCAWGEGVSGEVGVSGCRLAAGSRLHAWKQLRLLRVQLFPLGVLSWCRCFHGCMLLDACMETAAPVVHACMLLETNAYKHQLWCRASLYAACSTAGVCTHWFLASTTCMHPCTHPPMHACHRYVLPVQLQHAPLNTVSLHTLLVLLPTCHLPPLAPPPFLPLHSRTHTHSSTDHTRSPPAFLYVPPPLNVPPSCSQSSLAPHEPLLAPPPSTPLHTHTI